MSHNAVASPLYRGHFAGRRVAITGAARGIGNAITRGFAESGASIFLIDRDDLVKEAAEELCSAGFDAQAAQADVTDEQQMVAAFTEIGHLWGRLDTLINNAGIITINDLEKTSTADFERVLRVNTTAMFLATREATPLLRAAGGGTVLNAASGQARQGFIYTPAYAASKFGVLGLTQSLAKELAKDNIRVNAYCPGIVQTDMWDYNDREWGSRLGDYAPGQLMKEWIANIPLGRAASESDVTNLLLFLASNAATYITGQAVNIDGGMFMN
ncbi:SDR family NAD(P)-dependent oxidoreductase [Rhodococcus sp. NCIMB 12038]|jgi:meso-butanediol dehydrogenase/(S,S)-butanediol dehydrogenase/diacetyl reductase|uniref:SDR family NAD(P)-dependent oxidoreductase n=1 Tax=Rhodococcus sp. NCIMB 12038 TaxID=933800 RepID=UPI000B3CA6D4|nr:SDR family oxidoreductase [Rhodococcus sp. NCIMB 12038]OUS88546.1 SDR family oxidoreductase [Rhodococcus sp. NCIMB 12038]